ncbi:MAG: hypothetical protein ACOY9J_05290 [Pseudomonadota bacterium]
MGRGLGAIAVLAVVLVAPTAAHAEYSEECRGLAQRLAQDPGALKVGELDVLKSCLSDLQRGIVLGEPPPAKSESLVGAPTPAPAPPICPTAEQLCPRPKAAVKEPEAPKKVRERPREPDRRLKPYLPKY